MKYQKITCPDINAGLGFRVTLWISGCQHHCKFCHNPETWDFNSGEEFTEETENELISYLKKPYIKGLTLSGGDPVFSTDELVPVVKRLKDLFPDKDIWLFTGFTLDELGDNKLLPYVDYVVDGKYRHQERDISLAFRGSTNQVIWEKNSDGVFIKSSLN